MNISAGLYDDVVGRLRGLLVGLETFSASERSEVEHFIDVDEFGLALETLVAIIVEEKKDVPHWVRRAIYQLSEVMGLADQLPSQFGRERN